MDKLADSWASRDFPVLLAVAAALDLGPHVLLTEDLSAATGLAEDDVKRAVHALTPTYIEPMPIRQNDSTIRMLRLHDSYRLTERGRRAVGLWPGGDGGDALIQTLMAAAEMTPDPVQQGKLRKAAKALGGVSKDFLVEVTAAIATRQITGDA